MGGPVCHCGVISHLDPAPTDSTSTSSPIVPSSEAKSAFQDSATWLIYCWLRACHMAFREGIQEMLIKLLEIKYYTGDERLLLL